MTDSEVVPKFCNKCGRSVQIEYCRGQYTNGYSLPVTYISGYSSYALKDCGEYHFLICEGCLTDYMLTFTIPPRVLDCWGNLDPKPILEFAKEIEPSYIHPSERPPVPVQTPYELGWLCGMHFGELQHYEGVKAPVTPEDIPYENETYKYQRFMMGYLQGIEDAKDEDGKQLWAEPPP